jgi:hypothetical protein
MLDTPISIDVGGREVSTTASFNLGRVSQDSDIRIAGAAAELFRCLPS